MSKAKPEAIEAPCPIRNLSAKTGMGRVVAEAYVAKCSDEEKKKLGTCDMDYAQSIVDKYKPLPASKPAASSSDVASEAASGQASSRSQ